MSIDAFLPAYHAWKCGGSCSFQYIRMVIPKNRLMVGIGHYRALSSTAHHHFRADCYFGAQWPNDGPETVGIVDYHD